MKNFLLILILLYTGLSFAKNNKSRKHKDKKPLAKLKVSQKRCKSPCSVTLDGSGSMPTKGNSIVKYIFDLGNGETIESKNSSVEFTYINFAEESDKKKKKARLKKYKKWNRYINFCKKRFKNFDKFKIKLQVVQSDDKKSTKARKNLFVKPSDLMPTIDGDDIIPPIPDQSISDSTLLGIDVDGDGVRDDIELFINNTFQNESAGVRNALKQMSRFSNLQFSSQSDISKVKEYSIKSKLSVDCLMYQLEIGFQGIEALKKSRQAGQLVKKLNSITYNTRDRIESEIRLRQYSEDIPLNDFGEKNCEL